MRALVVVMLLATRALAQTPGASEATDQAPRRRCLPVYAEPSLLFGGSTGPVVVPGHIIARTAFGARLCKADVQLHAGLVLDIATDAEWGLVGNDRYLAYGYLGWGGELRATLPVEDLRIGPRLSVITDKGVWGHQTMTALWIGARLEKYPVIFGVDFVHVFDYYDDEVVSKRANGVYGSISLRGTVGGIIGAVGIVVLGIAVKIAPDHSS
jgi:hypothetical protein